MLLSQSDGSVSKSNAGADRWSLIESQASSIFARAAMYCVPTVFTNGVDTSSLSRPGCGRLSSLDLSLLSPRMPSQRRSAGVPLGPVKYVGVLRIACDWHMPCCSGLQTWSLFPLSPIVAFSQMNFVSRRFASLPYQVEQVDVLSLLCINCISSASSLLFAYSKADIKFSWTNHTILR